MPPAKLNVLLIFRDAEIDQVELLMYPFLVVIQNLHFSLQQFLPQALEGKFDPHNICVKDIIEHALAMRKFLNLEIEFIDCFFQLLLFVGQDVLYRRIGLLHGQHLVVGVFALQIVIDCETFIEAVHADHRSTSLLVLVGIHFAGWTDQFVCQCDGDYRFIAAGGTLDLQAILQIFLILLSLHQVFQAGDADRVSAVQFQHFPVDLRAAGTSIAIILSHYLKIASNIQANQKQRPSQPQRLIRVEGMLGKKARCIMVKNSQTGNRTPIHGFKVRCPHH